MRVHEIAKATGLGHDQVAAELGLEGARVHMLDVENERARAFMAEHGEVAPTSSPKTGVVRFWSPKKSHLVGNIQFSEWAYETEGDSKEAACLREVRDRTGVREVVNGPFEDTVKIDFLKYLEDIIYTGFGPQTDTAVSKEGMRCVRAILRENVALSLAERNSPKHLMAKIVETKSFAGGI